MGLCCRYLPLRLRRVCRFQSEMRPPAHRARCSLARIRRSPMAAAAVKLNRRHGSTPSVAAMTETDGSSTRRATQDRQSAKAVQYSRLNQARDSVPAAQSRKTLRTTGGGGVPRKAVHKIAFSVASSTASGREKSSWRASSAASGVFGFLLSKGTCAGRAR